MSYEIHLIEVAPQPMAAVSGWVNARNVAQKIPELLSQVWEFIGEAGLPRTGNNVVVYLPEADGSCFFDESGIPAQMGVLLEVPFEAKSDVFASATPAGRVATTLHRGPYHNLPAAHAVVHSWCAENGLELVGPNWEVYGHWSENPDELQTDVYYLLK